MEDCDSSSALVRGGGAKGCFVARLQVVSKLLLLRSASLATPVSISVDDLLDQIAGGTLFTGQPYLHWMQEAQRFLFFLSTGPGSGLLIFTGKKCPPGSREGRQ